MNRCSVSKVNVRQLFRRVSQLAVAAKIHLHKPFAFAVRGNPGNKTEVTVGHFLGVLCLHNTVMDTEDTASNLHFFLGRAERIDPFPNGSVELFGCRLSFFSERRKYLHIHTLESEPGNLAQIIRAFFEDVHTRRTKVLINFQRRGGRNLERSQKAHKVAQDAALGVGFLNVLELALRDAADLQQLLRLVVKDIQGVRSERSDNVLCRLGTDALDKPGTQVCQQTVRCLRNDFLPLLDLQLIAVLALDPLAVQLQFHRLGAGQFVPHRRKAQHTVAVIAAAASLQRNARIIGFDNDDGEFVCFVVKNRRFVGDTAAGNAAVFLFTVVHRHAPFFVRRLRPPLLP